MRLFIKFKEETSQDTIETLAFTWFGKNKVEVNYDEKEFVLTGEFYICLSNKGDKIWIENESLVYATVELAQIKRFTCREG